MVEKNNRFTQSLKLTSLVATISATANIAKIMHFPLAIPEDYPKSECSSLSAYLRYYVGYMTMIVWVK